LSEGLPLLCVRVNQARQLTQTLRGHSLKPDVADEIMSRLKECARLLQGKEVLAKSAITKTGDAKPTRRRLLWNRDPRCFWCGRVTRFDAYADEDAATVEHIYHRRHPKRKGGRRFLPSVVLACRKCNNERGAPPAEARNECPLIDAERKG
jgi:5-methylcytosine-specific restriction endonuclease McrA